MSKIVSILTIVKALSLNPIFLRKKEEIPVHIHSKV